jgi:hypothetical protein
VSDIGPATILGKRRICTRCRRQRVVNAAWGPRGPFLCKPCSLVPNAAYNYSLRRYEVKAP